MHRTGDDSARDSDWSQGRSNETIRNPSANNTAKNIIYNCITYVWVVVAFRLPLRICRAQVRRSEASKSAFVSAQRHRLGKPYPTMESPVAMASFQRSFSLPTCFRIHSMSSATIWRAPLQRQYWAEKWGQRCNTEFAEPNPSTLNTPKRIAVETY
jgi:hypothetical protein